jgi:hypothetical protein
MSGREKKIHQHIFRQVINNDKHQTYFHHVFKYALYKTMITSHRCTRFHEGKVFLHISCYSFFVIFIDLQLFRCLIQRYTCTFSSNVCRILYHIFCFMYSIFMYVFLLFLCMTSEKEQRNMRLSDLYHSQK